MSMKTIVVNAQALSQLLDAVTGPPHLIAELQATTGPRPMIGEDNPICILADEWNAAAEEYNKQEAGKRGLVHLGDTIREDPA